LYLLVLRTGCVHFSLEFIKPNVEYERVRVKPPQGITAEGCSVLEKHLGWIFCRSKIGLPGS